MTTEKQMIINEICNIYNISNAEFMLLVEKTNIAGVSFVSIRDYNSDVSGNTETANQLINVGANYDNMIKKDIDLLKEVNIEDIDINKFNYDRIDTKKLSLVDYKLKVKESLQIAYNELMDSYNKPKSASNRVSNDVWFNKSLVYNTNTKNLAIFGQQINKTVSVKGEFKKVASAPKTVAKELIRKQMNSRTDKLRRFKVVNITAGVNISNDTILL